MKFTSARLFGSIVVYGAGLAACAEQGASGDPFTPVTPGSHTTDAGSGLPAPGASLDASAGGATDASESGASDPAASGVSAADAGLDVATARDAGADARSGRDAGATKPSRLNSKSSGTSKPKSGTAGANGDGPCPRGPGLGPCAYIR